MASKRSRGLRFSSVNDMPESIRRAVHQTGASAVGPQAETVRKYRNVPTVVDGIRFDSKREAEYYRLLKFEQKTGLVSYFLRQVPIHLPGGTKLVIDFVVFMVDGRVRYVDAKGRRTKEFLIKRREVQHHYPIVLELV